jgi:hypothetical protein
VDRAAWATLRSARAAVPRLRSAALVEPSFVRPSSRTLVFGPAPSGGIRNIHPYPNGAPPEKALARPLDRFGVDPQREAVWATESGYHDALGAGHVFEPVLPQVAARYDVRLLLEYFRRGIRRTYLYELLDERPDPAGTSPEQHYGLVAADGAPKPAFRAVAELLRIVRSRGSGLTAHVQVEAPGAVHAMALWRRTGSLVLALWPTDSVWDTRLRRGVVPPRRVATVTFDHEISNVQAYDPARGTQPVMAWRSARRIAVPLRGDAVLLTARS